MSDLLVNMSAPPPIILILIVMKDSQALIEYSLFVIELNVITDDHT